MNNRGLVSISFRGNTPTEIVKYVKEAELNAIEWGGDVHVPHGDIDTAKAVKALCKREGILTPEYGSYYTVGVSEKALFDGVLASARTLEAPLIRIWGGNKSSNTLSSDEYALLVEDAVRIARLSGDITLCLECHQHTVTDEYHTAIQFIKDVNMKNLQMFWQPNQARNIEYNIDSLKALFPYVNAVHVFSWEREKKLPLDKHTEEWKKYIDILKDRDMNYMLEFMHDNNILTLKETAGTLNGWVKL